MKEIIHFKKERKNERKKERKNMMVHKENDR